VDGNFCDLFRRKWKCSVLRISVAPVISRQFLAYVNECEIHKATTGGAAAIFGRLDQRGADARALLFRIHGQHTEVASLAAYFRVDASGQHVVFKQHQERTFFHQSQDFWGICAVGRYEKALRTEGIVNEPGERGSVDRFRETNLRRGGQ